MREVGDHLIAEANRRRATQLDANLFGRSAFNRYYYAAFLEVRAVLRQIDADWGSLAHSAIPDLLENTVVEKVRRKAKDSLRKRLISQSMRSSYVRSAGTAAAELASVMRSAYQVRIVADYQPEELVAFDAAQPTLAGCTSDTALRWAERVRQHSSTLLATYRQLGLV